jgi:hypothetical protein
MGLAGRWSLMGPACAPLAGRKPLSIMDCDLSAMRTDWRSHATSIFVLIVARQYRPRIDGRNAAPFLGSILPRECHPSDDIGSELSPRVG